MNVVEENQTKSSTTINTVVNQTVDFSIEIDGVSHETSANYELERKNGEVTRDLQISIRDLRYDNLGSPIENLSGKKGMEIRSQIFPNIGRIMSVNASNDYNENDAIIEYYKQNVRPYLIKTLPTHMARMLDPNKDFKNP